jgi:multiple sugar transport system substrate-binding protein
MVEERRFSRRAFLSLLATGAGAVAVVACGGGASSPTATPTKAPAASTPTAAATKASGAATPSVQATTTAAALGTPQLKPVAGQQVVIWQTVDYLPQTTALLKERFTQVAQEKGFPITFEEIPNNPQGYNRFNAAVQAGTPPDIYRLYDYQTQFWRAQGQTVDITDLVQPYIRQNGGVWQPVEQTCVYKGRWWAAPYTVNAWPFHTRQDLLDQAGFKYPANWDEVRTQGKALTKPPLYYYGMTLGKTNDTNNHVIGMVWTFGGKLQNEDGTLAVTANDKAWLDTLALIQTMYIDDKIIPPGSVNWDDGGNNQGFQSEQLVITANPTSIYNWLLQNKPDLAKKTRLYNWPAGPAGSFGMVDVWTEALFKNGKGGDNARILLLSMLDPTWYADYINNKLNGRFIPCWKDMIKADLWTKNPLYAEYQKIIETGRIMGYAAAPLGAFGELTTKFVIGDMMQDLVVKKLKPADALANFVKAAQEIYSKPENRA